MRNPRGREARDVGRGTWDVKRETPPFFRPASCVFRLSLLLSVAYCLSSVSYAQTTVTSTELIERAKELNGKEVSYQGEAIGEAMARGEHFWINLNDGENAVGVWAPHNFLSLISFTGSYKAKGDWLEVKGIFNRACAMHGGDLDIHAVTLIKMSEGRAVPEPLTQGKHTLVIILLGVFIWLLIIWFLKKRLDKK